MIIPDNHVGVRFQDIRLCAGPHPRHPDGLHNNQGLAEGAGALLTVRALGAAVLDHGARHLHHHQEPQAAQLLL